MPSFISITAVLALASMIIASPQYGYENMINKRRVYPTGTAPLHTAPIHTGVSTGKIQYPTAGPKYTNTTSAAPKHTTKKGKSSSASTSTTSYESTTTIYVTAEDTDCASPTSYTLTTTLFSTIYVSSAPLSSITSIPAVEALPVTEASTITSTVTSGDEGEDCDEYEISTSTTILATAIQSSYSGKVHYYSTSASTPAAPVKPSMLPTLSWKGSWNGTVTGSSAVYPTSTGHPTGYVHPTGHAPGHLYPTGY